MKHDSKSEFGEILFTVAVLAAPFIAIVIYQGPWQTLDNLNQSIGGQLILLILGIVFLMGLLYAAAIPLACVGIPLAHWIDRLKEKRAKTVRIEFTFKTNPQKAQGQGELFLNGRSLGVFDSVAKAQEHVLNRRPSSSFSWVAMEATINGKPLPGGVCVDE